MKTYILNNGVEMPALGLGTWPMTGSVLENVLDAAIDIGYRLIDTADNYFNEDAIGNVLQKRRGIRNEMFIMTKISDEKTPLGTNFPWSSVGKYFYRTSLYMSDHTIKQIVFDLVHTSLSKLKTDYIDCLIMHWPYPDYFLEIWEAMIELYQSGLCRAIGVANCRERHLEALKRESSILPAINQISVCPLDTKTSVLEYCRGGNSSSMLFAIETDQ